MDKKNLKDYFCNCDYCSSTNSIKSPIKRLGSSTNQTKVNSKQKIDLKRSRSLSNIDSVVFCSTPKCKKNNSYSYGHELRDNTKNHKLCYYYYNLWQGETFKSKAFERRSEKLENQIKLLEEKLEKEILTQIRISLEWRNTVTKLVDENTKMKIMIEKLSNESIN